MCRTLFMCFTNRKVNTDRRCLETFKENNANDKGSVFNRGTRVCSSHNVFLQNTDNLYDTKSNSCGNKHNEQNAKGQQGCQ